MLAHLLADRALGSISPESLRQRITERQLFGLQPATNVLFDGYPQQTRAEEQLEVDYRAHRAGVNALVVERFEGRYLLSGGADGGISMWDLEQADCDAMESGSAETIHKSLGTVVKSEGAHSYGITSLSFYPFDSLAFLSSSYDHSLKVYSSTTLQLSAEFDLTSVVYSHAISPIASHLLVACATQHPAVRLVDLRSGAATHTLAGQGGGAVLSVGWSPRDEHVLVSGGTDGTVRFWDIRRSAGVLGVLDMDDSIGVAGYDGLGTGARRRERGKAHSGAVNGVVWTDDGKHVVTTGHDERIRVWDTRTAANTLANFGPAVKNRNLSTLLPLIAPRYLALQEQRVLFFPNEKEILVYEMFDGRLLKRLKVPGQVQAQQHRPGAQRGNKDRVMALAWRYHNVEMLSAQADGTIRCWKPWTSTDQHVLEAERLEEEDDEETEAGSRKRKRQALDDIYRELTAPKITYS